MRIGELAKAAGTQVETIRYYERQGLLAGAGRTEGNYRVYEKSHLARLAFVRHCRCLDMTLDEIRTLLRVRDAPQADCGEVNQLLDEHISHVVARIRELKALEKELRRLRESCLGNREAAHCGILGGLNKIASEHKHVVPHGAGAHLRGTHATVRERTGRTPK